MQSDIAAALRDIFRVGTVVSTSPASGTVRVQFPDADDMVSHDLQVLYHKTCKDKFYFMPDIGDLVACLFLGNGMEAGFVLGAVYNGADAVPVASQDKYHVTFKDGTKIEYDRAEHVLMADVKGQAEVTTTKDIKAEAGTTIDAIAGESANVTAPVFNINAVLNVQGKGGGGTTAVLKGDFRIEGSLDVTNGVGIGGDLSTAGNSYAGSRTGGKP